MKNKTVTNLLVDIGKARDLLEERDEDKIYLHCPMFYRIQEEVRKHVKRFFHSGQNYELDFNYYDLQELSDETYNFVKDFQQRFEFKTFDDEIAQIKPLSIEEYDRRLIRWEKSMKIDTYLRSLYKTLSYVGISLKYFDRSNNKEKKADELFEKIL